ncbi:uncharacterized protein LOC110022939 [Phalaenopsis equestris]|uniref:uncharacterized protein LOC110022939 n=1 Tax=Phalaenopsis equestris TaxID=78828 RepID=UPI0009E4484D|nr:uncharacterized protein LOC110022939 [Phalaenopsis equestris]
MACASLSLYPSLICSCSFATDTLAAASFYSSYSPCAPSVHFFCRKTRRSNRRRFIRSMAPDLLGDFGARDPFPAELESNFCEKVAGNENTEHRILIPNLSVLSLAQRSCEPVQSSQLPLYKEDAKKLLKKVVGWRLVESDKGMKIQCTWRVRDYGCGIELINRIYGALEGSGHFPDLHLEKPNQIRVELWTPIIGGLSLNDFIVAAKIDIVKTIDLIPKKRVWA